MKPVRIFDDRPRSQEKQKVTIVYGPAGCGKSRNSGIIQRMLAARGIVEEFEIASEHRFRRLLANCRHVVVLCQNPDALPKWLRALGTLRSYESMSIQERKPES